MGLETRACCDVYGSYKNVKRFNIAIREVDDDGKALDGPLPTTHNVYLCPRAKERLTHLIIRGVSELGKDDESKEASDAGTQSVQG